MGNFITSPARPSYACGLADVPLLGDTIGDNFDRTVRAGPRHEALVEVSTGRRWTYQQLRAEELCAWIKIRPGAEPLTAEKMREFGAGRLARYKVPRYVIVVDEFPLTVTGKVRKLEMREKSVALLGLEEAAAVHHA